MNCLFCSKPINIDLWDKFPNVFQIKDLIDLIKEYYQDCIRLCSDHGDLICFDDGTFDLQYNTFHPQKNPSVDLNLNYLDGKEDSVNIPEKYLILFASLISQFDFEEKVYVFQDKNLFELFQKTFRSFCSQLKPKITSNIRIAYSEHTGILDFKQLVKHKFIYTREIMGITQLTKPMHKIILALDDVPRLDTDIYVIENCANVSISPASFARQVCLAYRKYKLFGLI